MQYIIKSKAWISETVDRIHRDYIAELFPCSSPSLFYLFRFSRFHPLTFSSIPVQGTFPSTTYSQTPSLDMVSCLVNANKSSVKQKHIPISHRAQNSWRKVYYFLYTTSFKRRSPFFPRKFFLPQTPIVRNRKC